MANVLDEIDANAAALAEAIANDDVAKLASLVAYWHEQSSYWHGKAEALAAEVDFLRTLTRDGLEATGDSP